MGLADTVRAGVKTAFDVLGDEADGGLKKSITYRAVTLGGYDPATDTHGDTVTETPLEAVKTKPTEREFEWFPATNVETTKLLIEAADLAVEPTLSDRVLMDSVEHEVVRWVSVPGASLYIVFIQRP